VTEARDPEQSGGVEDVGADDVRGGHRKDEQHLQAEEGPAPDRRQADRSVPTARVGLKPKKMISIGVISEPPPIPVIPTRAPIRRPVRTNCQLI